jgi:regulatory protein
MDAALAMLGRRSHPAARVRERIEARFGAETADRTVARLLELRVLDDRAFAEAFTRDRFERAGYGRERIRAELLARGVAKADVEAAVGSIVDPERERETAGRALERFCGRRGGPCGGERKLRDAAFRHLMGRGFPLELVYELLGSTLAEPSVGTRRR